MILSILALLAGTRFLTHLLSTEEYGLLALAVSLAALAVQIFGEPIGKTAVRFYAHWRESGMPTGFMKRLAVSFATAAVWIVFLGLAAVAARWLIPGFPGMNFVVLTGLFSVILVFNRVALALEDAARKRWFRAVMQAGFEAGRFVFAVSLIVLLAAPDASAVLTGFILAGGLSALAHFFYLKRLLTPIRKEVPVSYVTARNLDTSAMQSFQLPLIVSNGGIWVVMMADRWVLTGFGSAGDVGGYSAVYQLAFIPMLLAGNFLILLLEPVLYQMIGINKKHTSPLHVMRINYYAAVSIAIFSIIGGSVFFFGHPLLGRIFLGADFRAYSWLFPWLILAGGSFAASQQLLLKLSCDMRTGLLAKVWGGTALVALTAYTVGAMFWQMKGVLAAVVGVNLCLLLFSLGIVIKKNSNEVVTGSKK
jgi:O-antigen/teichoic acid export membrane protein